MSGEFVKTEHYVPQCYLRRFGNAKEQICVYDKPGRRSFKTHIKNVAAENGFYDSLELAEVTGDRQFIEKHLRGIEEEFTTVTNALLESLQTGRFKSLKQRQRHFLSTYMIVQLLRTREHREAGIQMAEAIANIWKSAHSAAGLPIPDSANPFEGETAEELAASIQQRSLLRTREIVSDANILFRHIWLILEAYGQEVFLTSDHPIGVRPHVTHPWRSMSGIASKGIELVFPLSRRYAICLLERTHFDSVKHLDGTLLHLPSAEQMIYYNQFQVYYSNRFVFAPDGDFKFVEFLLDENPTNGDPRRRRVEIVGDAGGDCGTKKP